MDNGVKQIDDGWFVVEDGERRLRFAAAADANGTWVFCDGVAQYVEHERRETTTRRQRRSSGEVMSPMPATVVAINTAAGSTVNEGDTLIVLEAMKMELPIKSPRAGVVKAIHCAKGDLVQPGINLLELE